MRNSLPGKAIMKINLCLQITSTTSLDKTNYKQTNSLGKQTNSLGKQTKEESRISGQSV